MSLREEMWKYEQITGESAEHVPIIKLGAFLDGYEMGLKALEQQHESEIKPIGYRECSNAMLKMWMDNVLTDGEYNRIMDKLNAKWSRIAESEGEE